MKELRWLKLAMALALSCVGVVLLVPESGLALAEGRLASSSAAHSPIVGPHMEIWTDAVTNLEPVVAYNSKHDEYLAVWTTWVDTYTRNIWARRVGRDGSLRSWFNVATSPGEHRERPGVAFSTVQDNYLVAYTNWYTGAGGEADIFATLLSWDGGWMSSEFTITQAVDEQVASAVAYNANNDEYLVAYVNQWAGGLTDIYAQRVHAADGTLDSWSAVASGGLGYRSWPAVAYNAAAYSGDGGYLIAYTLYNTTTLDNDVRGKVTQGHLGDLWGNPEITICPHGDGQYDPALATGPDEYLAVWREVLSSGYQVRGRRVSMDGTPQGSADGFGISALDIHPTVEQPAVAYGGPHGYQAVWPYNSFGPTTALDIHGRSVRAGHDWASDSPFVIDDTAPVQIEPDVACSPSGDCLVVYAWWNGDNYDIGGRFLRPQRTYLPLVLRTY
jgi:hypothetical protein